jgi:hypothetical protein
MLAVLLLLVISTRLRIPRLLLVIALALRWIALLAGRRAVLVLLLRRIALAILLVGWAARIAAILRLALGIVTAVGAGHFGGGPGGFKV